MIEAMKQALEALEWIVRVNAMDYEYKQKAAEPITALRQAIAEAEKEATLQEMSDIGQEIEQWDTSDMAHRSGGLSVEQEPVAWMYVNEDGECEQIEYGVSTVTAPYIKLLYTALPKREWVSLTDDEVHEAAIKCVKSGQSVDAAIRAIEAKLKERNT
jgi:hypothetical protein